MQLMAVEDLAAPGLRTFCWISERWRLTQEEASVLLLRISLVLGIYKALNVKSHARSRHAACISW